MPADSRRNVGVANPRAVAELRAGRRIDWCDEDTPETVSRLLGMKYERLFDPKYGSPLYAGVPLDFSSHRCDCGPGGDVDIRRSLDTEDARQLLKEGLLSSSVLDGKPTNQRLFAAQIAEMLRSDLDQLAPPSQRAAGVTEVQRAAELSVASRLDLLAGAQQVQPGKALDLIGKRSVILLPGWWHQIVSDLDFGLEGEFFVDAPTCTAPVQGALGDCWLIAAMAAVAWVNPELISERLRRETLVGDVDGGHADYRFDFTDVLPINLGWLTINVPYTYPIWVGEQVPQASYGGYLYARSDVPGETWPAVLEKAAAVWRSGGDPNFPDSADYNHINGGDAAWACHFLTGKPQWYHWANASDAWSTIAGHCNGARANTPMTAWTWGSSDDSPDKVDYNGAGLVANHAYSLLGTWETNNRQYVVLRNPWGYHEGTLNTFAGQWGTPEQWGTASLTLPGNGVFALEIHTFGEYFMGFGGV